MDPKIKSLLILQDYDIELQGAQRQLAGIPAEIKGLEGKIESVRAEEAALKQELKDLEVKRSAVDGSLQEVEAKIVKLKTNQLEVKKNEEYNALESEIGALTQQVSDFEDEELAVMEAIEEKQAGLKEQESVSAARIQELEGQIAQVRKQENALKERVTSLEETVNTAKVDVDRVYLSKYEQILRQIPRGPYVVAIQAAKCDGCHLKVSNEIIQAAKKAEQPQQCDTCGRIVYWPDL